MSEAGLAQSLAKMDAAGVGLAARRAFEHAYHECERGVTGLIAERDIEPLVDPPSLAAIPPTSSPEAAAALAATVMIKLNGGLGTSMGLDTAKTLLPVRDGLTFLDIMVEQVRHARSVFGVSLPLIFMNSFRTRAATLAHLRRYPDLAVADLPVEFLQSLEPKLRLDDLHPVSWPADPSLEWCPPGHGDLYAALWESGLLDRLLDRGYRHASVANGDNLGAAPSARLAAWFAQSGAAYAAEVCPRTPNDRKGGHLAIRRSDGRLILRDSAQTAPEDQASFQDEHIHPFFHANNLWLDLSRLRDALAAGQGALGLPLIRNVKTVDPTDPTSTPVVQLESAMGAAIELFEGAQAIAVGRDRFRPVKTTNELMLIRSDVFTLGQDAQLHTTGPIPEVDLAAPFYRMLHDFESRVPVIPSLHECTSLRVHGDWRFDAPARLVGEVVLPATALQTSIAEADLPEPAP